MTKSQDIARLRALSEMVLESRLSELRVKALQRQTTIDKLNALRAPAPILDDQSGICDALAALNFQIWAESRRTDLSQTLARQTAIWLDSRDLARQAFGKARGFDKIAGKLQAQKRSQP